MAGSKIHLQTARKHDEMWIQMVVMMFKKDIFTFRFSRRGEISKYSPVFLGTCSLMDSIVCDKLSWIGLEKGMHLKCCNKLMANAFGTEGCEIS